MKRKIVTILLCCGGMLALILDAKTALRGAMDGIGLCLNSVIPSLFPFFVLSMLLTDALWGVDVPALNHIGRWMRMPKGSHSLLLIGVLGGYPTGAQAVMQCYKSGGISKTDAQRMLGFCSNAGPSFLFGIAGAVFETPWIALVLWMIHIFSAFLAGVLLPGMTHEQILLHQKKKLTLSDALERSVMIMGKVCGWIVLFRVLMHFLRCWFGWLLPLNAQIVLEGFLELANGCISLSQITNKGQRFVLCAAFLGFGGCSVLMQTVSVTNGLGLGMYIPGKILQLLISTVFACIIQWFLFPTGRYEIAPAVAAICGILLPIFTLLLRKNEIKGRNPVEVGV